MQFKKMGDKKILVLKDGYNKKLVFGFVMSICIIISLLMVGLNMPDNRIRLTSNNDSTLMFTYTNISTPKKMQYDEKTGIAQLQLETQIMNKDKKYKLFYEVYDDTGTKQQANIIISDNLSEDKSDETMIKKKVLLQFGVPKDYYYMKIRISQKDNTYQELIYDYRDIKKSVVKERGKDYLDNLIREKDKLQKLNEDKKYIDKDFKKIKSDLKKYDNLSKEEKNIKANEINELKNKVQELEEKNRVNKKEIELQNKIILDLEH